MLNFITSVYNNLVIMSDSTHPYRKYVLTSQLLSLYCALYKPSEMMGLVETKTAFKSILNIGLSFLRVLGAYNIYSEFVPWQYFRNYH